MMSKLKITLISLFFLSTGIVIGGYLFSQSQPRSFLAATRCQNCLRPSDFAGLLGSVGIQKFSGIMPLVVFETDKTIVIKHPFPEARIHYVIIPKKDIKNIGEISENDVPYIIDIVSVVRHLVEENKLIKYRLCTNGPGYQDVTYLHFHLTAK
jgi:hypothetical protein